MLELISHALVYVDLAAFATPQVSGSIAKKQHQFKTSKETHGLFLTPAAERKGNKVVETKLFTSVEKQRKEKEEAANTNSNDDDEEEEEEEEEGDDDSCANVARLVVRPLFRLPSKPFALC